MEVTEEALPTKTFSINIDCHLINKNRINVAGDIFIKGYVPPTGWPTELKRKHYVRSSSPWVPYGIKLPNVIEDNVALTYNKKEAINNFFNSHYTVCSHPKWLYDYIMCCLPLTHKQVLMREIYKLIDDTVKTASGEGGEWGRCLQAIKPITSN